MFCQSFWYNWAASGPGKDDNDNTFLILCATLCFKTRVKTEAQISFFVAKKIEIKKITLACKDKDFI